MSIWDSQKIGRRRFQNGIPVRMKRESVLETNGLLLSGVVVATYVQDDPDHPYANDGKINDADPVAVYCDVLIFSNIQGMRYKFIPRVLVSQDGGIHSGRVWKPRAATMNINEGSAFEVDPSGSTKLVNPAMLDGDHVLIGFLNNSFDQPVILKRLPHPSIDEAKVGKDFPLGHRQQLKVADGDPDFWRHHGTYYGVTDAGDFVVNTHGANSGVLESDGAEPAPDNAKGNQTLQLPQDATFLIEFADTAGDLTAAPTVKATLTFTKAGGVVLYFVDEDTTFTLDPTQFHVQIAGETVLIQDKDGNATFTLGDGAKSALIAEAFQNFFDTTLKNWVIAHTHGSGVGPTSVPIQAGTFPAYPTAATSTKVKFPDG